MYDTSLVLILALQQLLRMYYCMRSYIPTLYDTSLV